MASFVGLHNRIYLGHLDLTGKAHQVTFGPLNRAMQPSTTYADGGYACVTPGMISGAAGVNGYQDWAADALDDEISVAQLGTQYPFSVVPNPTGTVTDGDTAWLSRGVLGSLNPMSGAKGEMAGFEKTLAYDTAISQGKVAHALAARTSTGTGTAVALTGPSATQRLYAGLHVTAYSGLTNVVFKIQSDDSSGMSSATDRITFSTVTGTTSEWSSVAGSLSSETHWRVKWTVTGSGSVSFFCAFGVV